jgi:hypothetical protein
MKHAFSTLFLSGLLARQEQKAVFAQANLHV